MSKIAIITVHGVRWTTREDWQTRVGTHLKSCHPDIKVFHFRFGHMLAVLSWWMSASHFFKIPSWLRRHYTRKLSGFIYDLQQKLPDYEFSFLGHSFGGWILEQALMADERIKIKNLVFVHCPISEYIESTAFWNWLEMGRVQKVYAWSSHHDLVIRAVAMRPFGHNGYWGFMRNNTPEDRKHPLEKPFPLELYNVRTQENHFGVIDKLDVYGEQLLKQLI